MRIAFINALVDLAEKDRDIFLLTGDLGFSVLERFQGKFPDRYFDMGVAEANMVGVAAGLALSDKTVFVYSIVPFATMRCFEQVRNDLCYQNLNVKIIGIGGGLAYDAQGATHHAIEDIAIMRSLPNMCVICPGDDIETKYAVEAALKRKGPVYVRLDKSNINVHKSSKIDFKIGKGIVLKKGKDLAILATGNMLESAKAVAARLEREGISAGVVSMHTIKPLDVELVKELAYSGKPIFTIEEHNIIGGLGSAVSEVLAELDCKVRFKRIGIPDKYSYIVGCQKYLREQFGIGEDNIYKIIKEKWQGV